MTRLLTTLLLLMMLGLFSGGYYAYTLFLEGALLMGAHQTLQARHVRTQQRLKQRQNDLRQARKTLNNTQKELKQTRKALQNSQQKLTKLESQQPKGARRLANKASRIPVLGTIPAVGIFAVDLYDCYKTPTQCKEGVLDLFEGGKAYFNDPQ